LEHLGPFSIWSACRYVIVDQKLAFWHRQERKQRRSQDPGQNLYKKQEPFMSGQLWAKETLSQPRLRFGILCGAQTLEEIRKPQQRDCLPQRKRLHMHYLCCSHTHHHRLNSFEIVLQAHRGKSQNFESSGGRRGVCWRGWSKFSDPVTTL
jgi:hypothetical protein